jgi:hypothetical protein
MQEHRQQQVSVGQMPFHFWHMLKMFELVLKVCMRNINVMVKRKYT